MSDYMAKGRPVRKVADMLGLPLPKPETLIRGYQAWNDQPLSGYKYVTNATTAVTGILQAAGAAPAADTDKVDALVFEASGLRNTQGLDKAYQFYHAHLKRLARNGRVVLVVQTLPNSPEAIASQQALEGFMRSIAKEIGRKGATANMIYWEGNDLNEVKVRLKLPLLFLLSRHSAYVDAQPLRLNNLVALPEAVPLNQSLTGKIALVTGAARGIGASIAIRLAEEGARVVVLDHPSQEAAAKDTLSKTGGDLLLQDISAADAPNNIKKWLQDNCGGVDIIVHNAGITRDKTLAKMEEKQWQQVLQVNLRSILALNESLIEDTLRDHGRLIYMSSISGFSGNFGQTNYAATKAALIAYAKASAAGLAPRGITANAIAPGFIETKMTETMPFFTREGGRRLNNLSQAGTPEDIAEAAVFMAMPGTAAYTGQTLRVCGGSMIGA